VSSRCPEKHQVAILNASVDFGVFNQIVHQLRRYDMPDGVRHSPVTNLNGKLIGDPPVAPGGNSLVPHSFGTNIKRLNIVLNEKISLQERHKIVYVTRNSLLGSIKLSGEMLNDLMDGPSL